MKDKPHRKPVLTGRGKAPRNQSPATGFSAFFPTPDQNTPPVNREENHPAAPMAAMDYGTELAAKNHALARFWEHHHLPGNPDRVIASPRPRKYRTTSKRRCLHRRGILHLLMGDDHPRSGSPFTPSTLEPDEHTAIYRFLRKRLSTPAFTPVAEQLNYLIVRGNYQEQAVIFNVRAMNGLVIRKMKTIAGQMQKEIKGTTSAFVYLAPEGSDYYLESRQPGEGMTFKKLFGPSGLRVFHQGRRLDFHPTSFSQVNEAMAGVMVKKARELLSPNRKENLLDLYCGYGLFSHLLSREYCRVTGIDAEGPSIAAARDNCRHAPTGARLKFIAKRITARTIEELRPLKGSETVILDPPRQGVATGVVEAIAKRGPEKILHIFCNVDAIPMTLREWQQNGYRPKKTVPLDMFPGTTGLEVMILLRKNES